MNAIDYIEYARRTKEGDMESYTWLVAQFQDMAVSYAYTLLHDASSAQDAAQDAFILLYRNIHNLREPAAFITWLRRLVFSCCTRMLRKHKAEQSIDMTPVRELVSNESTDPHSRAEYNEQAQLIKNALTQLSPAQQEVFLQYYTFGIPYHDIALSLGVTESAVANRLYIGKRKLAGLLLPEMSDYLGGAFMDHDTFTQTVLNNLHNMVTFHHGQNYMFDACMGYLMECLHECPEYDYWFFSDVLGDSFTQVFHADGTVNPVCLSQDTFDNTFARKAFAACGYDCTYVAESAIKRDPQRHLQDIKNTIAEGLPVIAQGHGNQYNEHEFCIICGYDGNTPLILKGDAATPTACPHLLEHCKSLVFAGVKHSAPPIADLYRDMVESIPACIKKAPLGRMTFGKQAFIDWADRLLCDDLFTHISEAQYEQQSWQLHITYLCIIGTNGCARNALQTARKYCPDMAPLIDALLPIYEKLQTIYETITHIQAESETEWGFFITQERLARRDMRQRIAEQVRKAASCCDEILAVFENRSV